MNEQWGLRPRQEGARALSDLHLLQQDYQLLTMVHGEAVKQVLHLSPTITDITSQNVNKGSCIASGAVKRLLC